MTTYTTHDIDSRSTQLPKRISNTCIKNSNRNDNKFRKIKARASTTYQYQSSSMSIAIVPSGPSTAWMAPGPAELPANRLRLRTYSLCLACFFALINTSLPRLALFAPAYERLVAVPMLDRTLSVRAALPALALVGIFEPRPPPAAERESDDAEGIVDDDDDAAAAARCAPSLAMMREREIRGLRADGCCCFCC